MTRGKWGGYHQIRISWTFSAEREGYVLLVVATGLQGVAATTTATTMERSRGAENKVRICS
jgi:hypothetical protein